tara:strand:+ start:187 stop:618 length:432 start_codon:yes stop_codon:yes gene_type:complete
MNRLKKDCLSHALMHLEDLQDDLNNHPSTSYVKDIYCDDLHNMIFNTDYFIIGTWKARQWLGDNLLEVISYIREYEKNYFDFMESTTDFSCTESISNMISYILGEEIFQESKIFNCLNGRLYSRLNKFTLDLLIKEFRYKLEN